MTEIECPSTWFGLVVFSGCLNTVNHQTRKEEREQGERSRLLSLSVDLAETGSPSSPSLSPFLLLWDLYLRQQEGWRGEGECVGINRWMCVCLLKFSWLYVTPLYCPPSLLHCLGCHMTHGWWFDCLCVWNMYSSEAQGRRANIW